MKRVNLPDFSAVRGCRLTVALSGGADSVALLCMLDSARESLGLSLFAAHVDHGIRGEDSLADAEFCRNLCAQMSIPFDCERIDVPAAARISGEGLETAARRLRYEALRRFRQLRQTDFIVTAHHLNDQAETVLMHLLRGCGPEGISGMEIFSGDLYRPLLGVPKAVLENYLTERGVPWRTDATNAIADTPRNALRLHGLPALEESYPSAVQAIARYAESAQCENRYMERAAQAFLEGHLESGPYGQRLLHPEAADEAILRRALRKICGQQLSHERLIDLAALCRNSRGKIEITPSLRAERTPGAIYFLPPTPVLPTPVPICENGVCEWKNIGKLTVSPGQCIPVRDNPLRQMLRRDALQGAVLRTRRSGDRIRPLGCGERLLSDYMTDRKIDRPLRDFVPLVAVKDRILWVVGEGISEDAALQPGDHALCLEWTY